VLKLFRAEEDVILRLVCDASMASPRPRRRAEQARRRPQDGGRLGYMRSCAVSARSSSSRARASRRSTCPCRGRGGLAGLFKRLERWRPKGGTDLAKALDTVVRRSSRPGMLVVLSDFFDPARCSRRCRARWPRGTTWRSCRWSRPKEKSRFRGRFSSWKTWRPGGGRGQTIDPSALEAYVLRFAGLCEELRGFAKSRGAVYVRVRTDDPLEGACDASSRGAWIEPLRRRAASTRASVERVRVAARACDRERDETASFVLNSRCTAEASAAPAHTGDSPRFSVADRHTSPR
jgi:hypothetical protein